MTYTTFVHVLAVVGMIVFLSGGLIYLYNTLLGRTKPNRISWGIWSLPPLISAAAAFSAGADPWVTTRILVAGIVGLLVFAGSFINKDAYWRLDVFDIACGTCSIIALGAWIVASAPLITIMLAVLADALASIPTIRKAWLYPETENAAPFITGLISVLLFIPSMPALNIQNSAFHIYLIIFDAIIIFALYRRALYKNCNYFKNPHQDV